MNKYYISIFLLTLACNGNAIATNAAPNTQTATDNNQSPQQPLSHQEILTYLLKADMAAQRDMLDEALDNYLLVAKYTQDAKVAQLATEIAVQNQDTKKAMDAAEIWADAEPKDLQAQLVAVTLFIGSDPNKAAKYLNNVFELEEPAIDQHLLLILNQLPETGQQNLIHAIMQIADKRQKDPFAQLAAAQIAAMQMDITNASKYVEKALSIKPNFTGAIELNAKIIRFKADDDKPALAYLDSQIKKFPDNAELRLFYITALLDNQEITKAMPQLEILTKDKNYGGEAYLTMGEIYVSQDNIAKAQETIKKALPFPNSDNRAKFYLGQIAEYKKENSQAIRYYEDIGEDSEYHTQGFLRAAYLYAQVGNYEDALSILQSASPSSFEDQKQVLLTEVDILVDTQNYEKALDQANKILEVIPEDTDFLYARSVIFGLLDKPNEAENDLRAILKADPNNANALNALGFTLANQPNRVKEALPFLQKAISLSPENPAFLDSMGWLMFKMGRNQEAINILDKAYKISGNNEIAAHLGEVLWATGKKEAAREIWIKALSTPQDPRVIHDTLARLNISLTDLQAKQPQKAAAR